VGLINYELQDPRARAQGGIDFTSKNSHPFVEKEKEKKDPK
jgi:hypothetical protein